MKSLIKLISYDNNTNLEKKLGNNYRFFIKIKNRFYLEQTDLSDKVYLCDNLYKNWSSTLIFKNKSLIKFCMSKRVSYYCYFNIVKYNKTYMDVVANLSKNNHKQQIFYNYIPYLYNKKFNNKKIDYIIKRQN